jgi:hypothetical protein
VGVGEVLSIYGLSYGKLSDLLRKVKTTIIEYVVFEPNILLNDFDGLTVVFTHASPLRFGAMWVNRPIKDFHSFYILM